MPALDIAQIRAQAADLARTFAEPVQFVASTREFFQAHGAPAFRQSPIVSLHSPLKHYGTPLPVIRTLLGALRRPTAAKPEHGLRVAERLWAEPVHEQRQLAIALLGLAVKPRPEEAAAIMERWLLGLDDLELVDLLATQVGGPWLAGDLWGRLDEVRAWVNSPHKYQRQFGVMALRQVARDRNFGDVSAVLSLLAGIMRESDVEVRKAVAHLLRDLAPHGPGETTRFLCTWADTVDKNTNWIVRHAVANLDADAREEVLAILRGRRGS